MLMGEKMDAPSMMELFFIFFYIGLFTIGGGLVAITTMQQIVVGRGWITGEKFYNMVAISESTPGPIGVNMATYIGFEFHGVLGGIVATLGEILPSLVCIIIIAKCFAKFQERPLVKAAFKTLRPVTTGIIFVACAQVFSLALLNAPHQFSESWKTVLASPNDALQFLARLFKWKSVLFYAAALLLLLKTKINPILIILCGAAFGILFL